MTERLGFNEPLLLLAVLGIAAFALGGVLVNASDYSDDRDVIDGMVTTGGLIGDLGMVATGAAILLAAVRAEGHSTAIRAVMLVAGLVVTFGLLQFGFSMGFST